MDLLNKMDILNKLPWWGSLAICTSGAIMGCMTFCSLVDVPTFQQLVKEKDAKTIKRVFQIWWPNGRNCMVPLIATNFVTHAIAYWYSGHILWLMSGLTSSTIGAYTVLVLGEDIQALREANTDDLLETASRFCRLHHARFFIGLTGFILSISALGMSK